MSDLGSIARNGNKTAGKPDQGPRGYRRAICAGADVYPLGGKSTSEGNPSQPSLEMRTRGRFRFRWVVASGTRTVAVDVKQAANVSPRPSVVVLANSAIGVSETAGTAGSGTGWVTVGPVSISPSSAGAVWVELRANYDHQGGDADTMGAWCYWDNIVVT